MTTPVAVDIVGATQDFLFAQFPQARAVTDLPNDLEVAMPVMQIVAVGGPLVNSLSHASISIQVYAADAPTSMGLAVQAVNAIVMTMPKTAFTGLAVTGAKVNALPQFWSYDNPNVSRTVTLIDIYCHPA